MHRNRSIVGGVEPVGSCDRVDIAVENEADDISLRVDQRAAGITPNDVVAGR